MTTQPRQHASRWDWDLLFVAALALPIALVVHAINAVPVYLTADAGNTIADADRILGRSIRPEGHLPLFGAMTLLVRSFASELTTFSGIL